MTIEFTKKHLILLSLLVIFCLIGIAIIYFQQISPINESRTTIANELELQEEQVEALNRQLRRVEEEPFDTSKNLQRKLPVVSLYDQFILDLHRAEGLSNSSILNMNIDHNRDFSQNNANNEAEAAESEEEDGQDFASVDGVRQITVQLSVQAANYPDLASFITAIDQLPRLTNIDSLSFSGRDEQDLQNNNPANLQFNMTISTFYYPELNELSPEAPDFQYREPSGKRNPLYERQ